MGYPIVESFLPTLLFTRRLYQWNVTRCERIKTFPITASKLANVEKEMKKRKLRKAIKETNR